MSALNTIDPTTLTAAEYDFLLQVESVFLAGNTTLLGVLYGIMLCIYAATVYFFLQQRTSENWKSTSFYITYATVMAALGSLYVGISGRLADEFFLRTPTEHAPILDILAIYAFLSPSILADGLLVGFYLY